MTGEHVRRPWECAVGTGAPDITQAMIAMRRTGGEGVAELSANALRILEARYLRRDPTGRAIETPDGRDRC
jgi:hypothetical protein